MSSGLYSKESELFKLCEEYCEWYGGNKHVFSATSIYNALYRSGIHTVEDLKNADEDRIAKTRNVGRGKKFGLIMTMKLSLE